MLKPRRLDQSRTYKEWVTANCRASGVAGLEAAIGGEFAAFGIVELEILRYFGLTSEMCVIDVGCGAGRLAQPLSHFLHGSYLGTDVVPDLVSHARKLANRSDWRFEVVDKIVIRAADSSADFVCFFSAFTHLLHEQTYLYLTEARRVLKPGGVIVFSFLEFAIDFHWNVFEATVRDELAQGPHPLNMFLERTAINRFIEKLGLDLIEFRDGGDVFVPLPAPLTLSDGRVMEKFGNLGQSICAIRKAA